MGLFTRARAARAPEAPLPHGAAAPHHGGPPTAPAPASATPTAAGPGRTAQGAAAGAEAAGGAVPSALRRLGGGAMDAAGSSLGWLGNSVLDTAKQGSFQILLLVLAALGTEQLMKRLAGDEAQTKPQKQREAETPKSAPKLENGQASIDAEGRQALQAQAARMGFAGGRAEAGSALRSGSWHAIEAGPSRGVLLQSGKDSLGVVERRDGAGVEKAILVAHEQKNGGVALRRGVTMEAGSFEIGADGKVITSRGFDADVGRAVGLSNGPLGKAEEIALAGVNRAVGAEKNLPTGVVADPVVVSGADIKGGRLTSQLVTAAVNGRSRSALFEAGRVTLTQEENGVQASRVVEDASIAPGHTGFGFSSAVGTELHGFMSAGQAPGRAKLLQDAHEAVAAAPDYLPAGGRALGGLER